MDNLYLVASLNAALIRTSGMYGLESLWFNIKDGYVGERDNRAALLKPLFRATSPTGLSVWMMCAGATTAHYKW